MIQEFQLFIMVGGAGHQLISLAFIGYLLNSQAVLGVLVMHSVKP